MLRYPEASPLSKERNPLGYSRATSSELSVMLRYSEASPLDEGRDPSVYLRVTAEK